jgi:hypothetical protein
MKPFLSGRAHADPANLQTFNGLSPAQAVARAAAHKHLGDDTAGPTVEEVKQGDKIVRLIVTCSCGERIEIDCLYPGGG